MTRDSLPSLANDLRIACQRVSRRVRFDSTHELPPHHVAALGWLRDVTRSPGELAALEQVSRPSMTRTVNCLVAAGYVARADDPADGRRQVLSLTDAGRAVLRRTARNRDDWMVQRLSGLSASELALVRAATDLLDRVVAP